MRNLFKQLKKGSREVRLTTEEKNVMRQTLMQFARENPAVRTSQTKNPRGVPSPYSFMRKTRGYRVVSATIIGGLLIGGTVSFAAEGVLPGNVLYPVKTQVNERVRGLVATTPHAKAEWDIALVERRLSEMKEVGSLESVPSDTKEFARENVKKYTERAQKRIAEFDDNDDDEEALEIAENLARVLQAHETELLENIEKENDEDNEEYLDETDTANVTEITQERKEPSKIKKEIKRIRTTITTITRASSTLATSTPSVSAKNTSRTASNEERKTEDVETARTKNNTESLEKTVGDIREVRENLEKRNREKKAEYERRKESRQEEERKDEERKEEEQRSYLSKPSPEQER